MRSINYSQCWEDVAILRAGLRLTPSDRVLSVGSGGDNSLALLLDDPESVTVIDVNPAQIYLIELKVAAMRVLDYDDFIGLMGAEKSSQRWKLYQLTRTYLSPEARAYWDHHRSSINCGVIHIGKFERYLKIFRQFVLPLVVSRSTAKRFLATRSLLHQRVIYRRVWNCRRWRLLFSLFFSRALLGKYGRCQGAFAQVEDTDISVELFKRTERGLTCVAARDNYLLRYILTGAYELTASAPEYLQACNFTLIRQRLDHLHFVTGSLTEHLQESAPSSYSAFNLSDTFEYMTESEIEEVLDLVLAASRPGGRILFWTMFLNRTVPQAALAQIEAASSYSTQLRQADRGFFYGSVNLWKVKHGTHWDTAAEQFLCEERGTP